MLPVTFCYLMLKQNALSHVGWLPMWSSTYSIIPS